MDKPNIVNWNRSTATLGGNEDNCIDMSEGLVYTTHPQSPSTENSFTVAVLDNRTGEMG